MLHYSLGELQEAREFYLKTIELDDACLEDFYDLGKVENSLGEFESSTVHLLKAIAINSPRDEDSAEVFYYLQTPSTVNIIDQRNSQKLVCHIFLFAESV